MSNFSRNGKLYRRARIARQWAVAHSKGLRGMHPTASIHRTSTVSRDLVADEYAYVGPHCLIAAQTHLGAYCLLADRVAVLSGDHATDEVGTPMQFSTRPPRAVTTVGRDAWLGYGVIVTRGVAIGEGAVVGAGSVVTCDIPEYEIWAGVPARRIRGRFSPEDRERHRQALDRGELRVTFAEPVDGGSS